MAKQKKFMIVDGNAILHRAWHALPPTMALSRDFVLSSGQKAERGQPINAVYGFVTTLFKAINDLKPDFVAITFDRKEKTFRHEAYKEYKATRTKQPDELYNQLPILKEVLAAFNLVIYEKAGFEADDLIGTLCSRKSVDRQDVMTIVVTGDMDTLQLVDDNTEVYTMRKGMSDTMIYDVQAVRDKFEGLGPESMVDYKGLRGDPSDNIPGVPGVGEKTAIVLLKEFGTVERMYEELKEESTRIKDQSKVKDKSIKIRDFKITERMLGVLLENEDKALMSKKLATIKRDVEMEFSLAACALPDYDGKKVFEMFQKLEFKSLLNRLPALGKGGAGQGGLNQAAEMGEAGEVGSAEEEEVKKHELAGHDYVLVRTEKEFEKFWKELKKQKEFVFDTETNGLDVLTCKLLGISFCWEGGKAYYVVVGGTNTFDANTRMSRIEKIKEIFEDEGVRKMGHNMKFDVEMMRSVGIEVKNLYFDTMVGSYLLNPGTRTHKLDDLVFRELGYKMTAIEELIGQGKGQTTLELVSEERTSNYSAEDADYTFRLVARLEKELKKNKLWDLFQNIEMPLIEVLIEMEMNGVLIDVEQLKKLEVKLKRKIKSLTEKIYDLAGEEFNISSPRQLKTILFDKLEISQEGLGRTKTGVSTAAAQLEKMRDQHQIIPLIEDYREFSKLLSTYVESLPKLVNKKTGRVHTDFNQTVTATGRLSSSSPNFQNIPIRTEWGQEIRKAVVAPKGYKIVAADYSQVELRVAACLAKDKNMMAIFEKGEDIHTATAAEIFGVSLAEVTKEMRSSAKEVNFGVLYGMGAWGLAARRKIPRWQAQEFIEKYFKTFSQLKKYIEKMKEEAREKEYVETLFGRRRYLPEINSGIQQVKAAAERMAVNMPVQGTAADLMKIAMVEVHRALRDVETRHGASVRNGKRVKMILQVHDELVFEVPDEMVEQVAKIIDEKMEKVHKLCVPINVDTEVGENWQEMEKVH